MKQFPQKCAVIGATDGIPSEAIAEALRQAGYDVVFVVNQFFV